MMRSYDLSPDQVEAIDRLAKSLGINKTSVLMNGLALIRVAINEKEQGNSLAVIRDGKVIKEIVGAWSPTA
jgi:hypothetical protein